MSVEDLRGIPANTRIEADLCIIGSGPAGWTIAEELQDLGLDILIIESGGTLVDAGATSQNEFITIGSSLFIDGRDRILGGTSLRWGGRCIALDAVDYEARSWVPLSGWPFGHRTVAPFLDRAARHLGAGPRNRDGTYSLEKALTALPKVDAALLCTALWEDPTPVRFRHLFSARKGVRCIVNATVSHLNTDVTGTHLVSLEVSNPNNERRNIRTRAAVLCAGGIENARILLYSNRNVSCGIGNEHDAVGRYLTDHPRDPELTVRFRPDDAKQIRTVFGPHRVGPRGNRREFVQGFAFSPQWQRDQRLLNCAAWPSEIVSLDDPVEAAKRLYKRKGRTARDIGLLISQPGVFLNAIGKRLIDQRIGRRVSSCGFLITSEQVPNPSSRVSLMPTLDRLDLPIAGIDWRIGRQEAESQAELAKTIQKEFIRLSLPRADLADWVLNESYESARFVDGCHPSGTTRMGTDPLSSVVDANCRVHSVDNLYIAGSSVFPTGGHANPTLTIVALAIRLAEHLKIALLNASR